MSTPSLLPDVRSHFQDVIQNPSKRIDSDLLDKFELQLNETLDDRTVEYLVGQITQLILTTQQDASPLAKLGTKVVNVSKLNFSDFISFNANLDLAVGLTLPRREINLLVLAIIGKASQSTSEAALVAGKPELVTGIFNLWLRNQDTSVSSAALVVLLSLLETDQESSDASPLGSGLMWRRVFSDRMIYETLYSTCSMSTLGQPGNLDMREKSIAQGRLLEFVKKVAAMDWATISQPHFFDIELRYGVRQGGVLEFVACHMIDIKDALSHLVLIQFYTDLLAIRPLSSLSNGLSLGSSPALEFLLSNGLHERTLTYFLRPSNLDEFDVRFLSGPAALYLSRYCSLYPKHLLERSGSLVSEILDHISTAFDISPNAWGQQAYPKNSLLLLSSLPRALLLQGTESSRPLLMLPTRTLNADIFHVLGLIFHGPDHSDSHSAIGLASDPSDGVNDISSRISERAAARAAYFSYLHRHPDMWTHVVAAADSIALRETALAAVWLVEAVMTADWGALPANHPETPLQYVLPTEDQFRELGLLPPEQPSLSGVWAFLVEPAITTVLPFLFSDPHTFVSIPSSGDSGSIAYEVALAKFDVLVKLRKLVRELGVNEFEDVNETIDRIVARGPWRAQVRPGQEVEAMDL